MVRFLKHVVIFILLNKVIVKLYFFDKSIIELHYLLTFFIGQSLITKLVAALGYNFTQYLFIGDEF